MSLEVEGIPRHQEDNPYNYTEEQKDAKKLALKTIKELYPDVEPYYSELVYDMVVNSSEEEIEKIKQKVLTQPFKYAKEILEIEKK